MKNSLITLILCVIFGCTQSFAQSGDLEVVSIDPEVTNIENGRTTDLILVVNQNGPGNLPVGSARVSISISTAFINWIEPVSITDDCGGVWSIQTTNPTATTVQIQLRNNNGVLANGAGCEIRIPVKGVAEGSASITVSSTVFGAGVSDPNGTNQGATGTLLVSPSLPVTLTSFNVTKENTTANLAWSTTEETNSERFDIEHSLDAKRWTVVGTQKSNGESSILRNYTFPHATPGKGTNYYRLKMIDMDGTYAYSSTRSIDIDQVLINVYPNPVADVLTIGTSLTNLSRVQLYNTNGTSVYDSGKNVTDKIAVGNLSGGIYLVRLSYADGTSDTRKIVVKK
jgi:hypothetical protein